MSNLMKIETQSGWEIWTDVSEEPIVAMFTEELDADCFIATRRAPTDFKEIALRVAEAYPCLNLSDAPLNASGELVLNIARIIEKDWLRE